MKLRVVAPGMSGDCAKVFLDDKELHSCSALDIKLGVGELNEAVLCFHPSTVEIEGEFAVMKTEINSHKYLLYPLTP